MANTETYHQNRSSRCERLWPHRYASPPVTCSDHLMSSVPSFPSPRGDEQRIASSVGPQRCLEAGTERPTIHVNKQRP